MPEELIIVIFALLSSLTSSIVYHIFFKPKKIGYLRIDRSDEQPYLFLELTESLDTVLSQKTVIVKVKIEDYIPRN